MLLSEFFHSDMVWPNLTAKNKSEAILELAKNIAGHLPYLNSEDVEMVLTNREKLGSTGIQDGIAIPHAKLPGLDKIVLAFGRSKEGVDFQALDKKPTHLFFVLLAPEHATAVHLKILARLSRILKESSFCDKLLSAKNSVDIYSIIIEEDKKY